MNKEELVKNVAAKTGESIAKTKMTIDAFTETVGEELHNGSSVQIVGFGTFETRIRAARKGINIRTKKPIDIAEKRVPAFKAGKALKNKVEI